MDTTPGNTLVIGDGKCWSHMGKYMGKYLKFELVGRMYDPDPEYTFEHGVVYGLGMKFTEVRTDLNKQSTQREQSQKEECQ